MNLVEIRQIDRDLSFDDFEKLLAQADALTAAATIGGRWVTYVGTAPAFVNDEFVRAFPAGIPSGQLLLLTIEPGFGSSERHETQAAASRQIDETMRAIQPPKIFDRTRVPQPPERSRE